MCWQQGWADKSWSVQGQQHKLCCVVLRLCVVHACHKGHIGIRDQLFSFTCATLLCVAGGGQAQAARGSAAVGRAAASARAALSGAKMQAVAAQLRATAVLAYRWVGGIQGRMGPMHC